MALTMPMPIKLDGIFNNAGLAGLTGTSQHVADTSTHQSHKRKFATVSPPRWPKQKCSTLKSCVRKHRAEASNLAKSRRRVQFHSSVKKHDGISTANAHLDRVVYDFWKKQNLDLLAELSRDSKHTDLNNLVIKLRDLLHRIRQSGSKATLLLPRGGGRSIKLSKLHIPVVNHLLQRAIQARDECMRRHERLLSTRKNRDALGLVLEDNSETLTDSDTKKHSSNISPENSPEKSPKNSSENSPRNGPPAAAATADVASEDPSNVGADENAQEDDMATQTAEDVVPKGGKVVSKEGQHALDKLVAEAVSEAFVSKEGQHALDKLAVPEGQHALVDALIAEAASEAFVSEL